ncbi:MAG: NAD(P)H-dependent glycerol-3-phosphate dehydrogenase [Candidatus Bipolaricaulota bacterium]
MRAAVLGGGSWGTAFCRLLVGAGHTAILWTRREEAAAQLTALRENLDYLPGVPLPAELQVTPTLPKAVQEAQALFLAVPSFAMRAVATACNPHLPARIPLVHLAKGLDPESGLRMSEVLAQELPGHPVFALSGPSHAEEVARDQPTAVVLAGTPSDTGQKLQTELMAPRFRVYLSEDLLGVEYCSVIKNVLAVGTGISDGLGHGDNARAALVARGLAEMTRFGRALGARPETFYGLAGLGDLVATATSDLSRNRRAGVRLGQGEGTDDIVASMHMVAEGLHAATQLWALAQQHGVDMPITEAVYRIVHLGEPPAQQIPALMERPPKWE